MDDLGLAQDVDELVRTCSLFCKQSKKKGGSTQDGSQNATKVPLVEMLHLAVDTIKAKAVMAPNDMIGVAFYNTEKANVKDFKNIHVHVPIKPITADACLRVADLLSSEEDESSSSVDVVKENMSALCGTAEQHISTSNIFWAATDLFNDLYSLLLFFPYP